MAKVVAFNLNRVIDVNYYPVPEARRSNMRHRPIGIGIQGLADTFMSLRMPFDSPEARELNVKISETIYHAALEAVARWLLSTAPMRHGLAVRRNKASCSSTYGEWSPRRLWDWQTLKAKIAQTGLRNSLLVAPMPTASTSQILGNNECFEPYTRYMRQPFTWTS